MPQETKPDCDIVDWDARYGDAFGRLAPVLPLYESAEFQHEAPPEPSDYDRADVYMVYRPARPSNT